MKIILPCAWKLRVMVRYIYVYDNPWYLLYFKKKWQKTNITNWKLCDLLKDSEHVGDNLNKLYGSLFVSKEGPQYNKFDINLYELWGSS